MGNRFAHKFLLASFMLLMVAVTLIGAMAYSNATRLSAMEVVVKDNNALALVRENNEYLHRCVTLMVENRAIMEDIRGRLDKVEENE